MNKKRGRPPKDADQLKNENLLIRLEQNEKETFQSAADLAGLSLSSWVRERLKRVAIRELKSAASLNPLVRN